MEWDQCVGGGGGGWSVESTVLRTILQMRWKWNLSQMYPKTSNGRPPGHFRRTLILERMLRKMESKNDLLHCPVILRIFYIVELKGVVKITEQHLSLLHFKYFDAFWHSDWLYPSPPQCCEWVITHLRRCPARGSVPICSAMRLAACMLCFKFERCMKKVIFFI